MWTEGLTLNTLLLVSYMKIFEIIIASEQVGKENLLHLFYYKGPSCVLPKFTIYVNSKEFLEH